MPEPPPQPPKEIIELCGVVAVEQEPGAAGINLSVATLALGIGPVKLAIGESQMAVLRYAGNHVAMPTAGGDVYVEDSDEHVEFVGGNKAELPDTCFRLPGRKGGLLALNPNRVEVEEQYTHGETAQLQRLREKGVNTTRLALSLREKVTRVAIQRQTTVIDRLAALASVDVVLGTVDPSTARQRALYPPAEEFDGEDPNSVSGQATRAP